MDQASSSKSAEPSRSSQEEPVRKKRRKVEPEEAKVREVRIPENFQFLPSEMIGIDDQVEEIVGMLVNDNKSSVGLVGMGGLGKTTLSKAIFNKMSPHFEYSCFIQDVKLIAGRIDTIKREICGCTHRNGKTVKGENWFGLMHKRFLLVLDDVSLRDTELLQELASYRSTGSRLIVTSQEHTLLENLDHVHIVRFLKDDMARQLFLKHAFPQNGVSPVELEGLVKAIVKKCNGLPLTLDVIGKFLRRKKNLEDWKETFHALDKAEGVKNINERLWAKLRASFDGLQETEQQMFLDATTCFTFGADKEFFGERCWTLREAQAMWRVVYETDCVKLLWQTLVDMSLVYNVGEHDKLRMHEQLQSLGRKIVSEPVDNGRWRIWDKEKAVEILQSEDQLDRKEIHALQFIELDPSRAKLHISNVAIHRLRNLRYLEMDGDVTPVHLNGAEGLAYIPTKLVLLDCRRATKFSRLLLNSDLANYLVILKLAYDGESCLPDFIGSFSSLKIFTLYSARQLERLPETIGQLSHLETLHFSFCPNLRTLPESFGDLSALTDLKFQHCNNLCILPESFGKLIGLQRLSLERCNGLDMLPTTFGKVSALSHLEIEYCKNLNSLPESFGELPSLRFLNLEACDELPESFGNLSTLETLTLGDVQTLPESFGQLKALRELRFFSCRSLLSLPESFGQLNALRELAFFNCSRLESLCNSFGQLNALEKLEFISCERLRSLPESFGQLKALNRLEFDACLSLQYLPVTFGNLSALNYLRFTHCPLLRILPQSLGTSLL